MPLPNQCVGDDPCPFKKRRDANPDGDKKCPECGQTDDQPAGAADPFASTR